MLINKVTSTILSIVGELLSSAKTLAIPISVCMVVGYLVIAQVCDEQSQQKYIKRIKIIAVILLAVFLAEDIINWLMTYVK